LIGFEGFEGAGVGVWMGEVEGERERVGGCWGGWGLGLRVGERRVVVVGEGRGGLLW